MHQKPQDDLFGPIIGELSNAVRLLGGDSVLLATLGSWRDTIDDEAAYSGLREWVDAESSRQEAMRREINLRRENGNHDHAR